MSAQPMQVVFPLVPQTKKVFDVRNFGAKCDLQQVQDLVATNGSAIVTSATANWTQADVGKKAFAVNFGTSYYLIVKNVTIASVQSSTQCTLSGGCSASSTAGQINTFFWGTDDTSAIQAALNEAQNYTQTAAQQAGAVVLLSGSSLISSTLTVYHHTWFKGLGFHCILCAAPDIAAAMITNDTHSKTIRISDFTLQGNRMCQGTPTNCHGIVLNSALTGQNYQTTDELYDAHSHVHDMFIRDTGGDGLQATGGGTSLFSDIWVYSPLGRGVVCTQDCYFNNVDVTQSQLEGWAVLGGNNHFTNCKGNLAGNLTGAVSAAGWGWHIQAGNQPNFFSACDAQDSSMDGWYLDGSSRQVLSACNADSCNNGTSTTYAAIKINNSYNNNITSFVAWDRFIGSTPPYGGSHLNILVDIEGGSSGNYIQATANFADDTHFINNGVNYWATGNCFIINCQLGLQTPAFASSFTPDAYNGGVIYLTLTGNITINQPSNGHPGCIMTFVFQQDATGSRTVTWASYFKQNFTVTATANAKSTVTFMKIDGANWAQISSSNTLSA